MTDFHDERRYDSELRAKCAEIDKARRAMLDKAAKQLKELSDEMAELDFAKDDGIYSRCSSEVWSAYYKVSRDAEFMRRPATETYIGNMAAGELGEYIQKQAAREQA